MLCRILVKCRALRIFSGKKFSIPGTKTIMHPWLSNLKTDALGYISAKDRPGSDENVS